MRIIQTALIWCVLLVFTGLTFIVAWFDRKLQFALPFPRDVEELANKQTWCINRLKQNGILPGDAAVQQYQVKPLNQDMIFRSNAGVIDIHYSLNGEPKRLQCFAKFAPNVGSIWNRTIFNVQLNHIKEIDFNSLFVKADPEVPSPVVYVAEMSVFTGNLCLITELMNGDMEYNAGLYDSFLPGHLELAIEGMATLHARYWNCTEPRMSKVHPIENSTLLFFDSLVASSWSKQSRKILMQSWQHMNQLQTVVHGDARIGNMMFPKSANEGRFVFIDWQAVRKGMGVYDLAYFLVLSLSTTHRSQVEEDCIKSYHQHLLCKGVTGYSFDELLNDYNHACLCVLVLLSLPFLSGEASAEGNGNKIFVFGMGVWRDRMQTKFNGFDYAWIAKYYHMTEEEGRTAVEEMLNVISTRLTELGMME